MDDTKKGYALNEYGVLTAPDLREGYILQMGWSRAMRGGAGEPRPDFLVEIEGRDRRRLRFCFHNVENAIVRDFGVRNVVYEALFLRDHQIQDEDLHCLIEGFGADAYSATCLSQMRGRISHEQLTLVVFVPASGAKLSILCHAVELEPV